MKTLVSTIAIVSIAAAFAVTGCGKSKEQEVMEKMSNRKRPGNVRLLNLSSQPLDILWNGRPNDMDVAVNTHSRFRFVGEGEQQIGLGQNQQASVSLTLKVEEGEHYTVVAFGDGSKPQYTVIEGEYGTKSPTRNLQLIVIDETGKPAQGSLTLVSGGNKYELNEKSGDQVVAVGNYEIEGEGLTTKVGGEVTDENMYSVVIFKTKDGKSHAVLLRNTFIEKPSMGGAS
jgi:hypothetical protein